MVEVFFCARDAVAVASAAGASETAGAGVTCEGIVGVGAAEDAESARFCHSDHVHASAMARAKSASASQYILR